jgi:hypothetical protein
MMWHGFTITMWFWFPLFYSANLQVNLTNANLEGALVTGSTCFKGSNIYGAGNCFFFLVLLFYIRMIRKYIWQLQFSQTIRIGILFAVGWNLVDSCVTESPKHLVLFSTPSDFTDVPLRDDQRDYLCKAAHSWGGDQCRYAGTSCFPFALLCDDMVLAK